MKLDKEMSNRKLNRPCNNKIILVKQLKDQEKNHYNPIQIQRLRIFINFQKMQIRNNLNQLKYNNNKIAEILNKLKRNMNIKLKFNN